MCMWVAMVAAVNPLQAVAMAAAMAAVPVAMAPAVAAGRQISGRIPVICIHEFLWRAAVAAKVLTLRAVMLGS